MKIKLNGNDLELTDDQAKEIAEKYGAKKEVKTVGIAIRSVWGSLLFQSSKTTLVDAIREADLSGANLSGANLSEANLSGADLSEADLSEANLSGADLSGADLSGADLSEANLSGADLSGADLSGANLREANLSGADLSGADLSGANLREANLSGADLPDLYKAKFHGTGGQTKIKKSQLDDFLKKLGVVAED